MAHGGSHKVIYAALGGNALIAVTKIGAGVFTGSSAMLSEAIHSFVDTGNQGLMLLGIARSKRKPDDRHPFGYWMEVYFWAFVVAILIFGLGAGISFYEGLMKLLEPHPVTSFLANYAVLEAADPETVRDIRRMILAEPEIRSIGELRTLHFGPRNILVAVSAEFGDGLAVEDVERTVARVERKLRERVPQIGRLFLEAENR